MKRLLRAFANLRLAVKMVLMVGLMGLCAAATLLYSMANMHGIDREYRGLIDHEARSALLLSDAALLLSESSRLVYAVLTESESARMREVTVKIAGLHVQFDDTLALIRPLMPEQSAALELLSAQAGTVFGHAQAIGAAAMRWRGDRALMIIHDEFEPALAALRADMDALRDGAIDTFRQTAASLSESTRQTIWTAALAAGGALLLMLLLSAYVTVRLISRPITGLTGIMRRLTDRQYDDVIEGTTRRDEVGVMAQALQVFRDTMQRADRLSAEVVASEQARRVSEQLAQEKAAFLAVMSHEIRTPLNGMLGMAQLALKSELSVPQRERVATLLRAGRHLQGIINDILDFSRIDSGNLQIEAVVFDLDQMIADVLDLLGETAAQKGVPLRVQRTPAAPRLLVGDPLRLSQILLNYLGNAIKFTEQGEIRLEVDVQVQAAGAVLLTCAVHDTGIGMNDAQLAQLFQPFRQADASVTRRFGGTGLGLAISRRLAELMGGEVGVRSTLGEGSVFWFSARVALAPPGARPLAMAPDPDALAHSPAVASALALPSAIDTMPLRGRRVLLVDDNALNRTVAAGLLAAGGVQVDVATQGREAVETLRHMPDGTYAAVLMDMQMPVMDGMSATRLLRAEPRFRDLPILAMTANASPEDKASTRAAGMNAHLAKPVDEDLLWRALLRWATPRLTATEPRAGVATPAALAPLPIADVAGLTVSGDTVAPAAAVSASLAGEALLGGEPAAHSAASTPRDSVPASTPRRPVPTIEFNAAPLLELQRHFTRHRFETLVQSFIDDGEARVVRISAEARLGAADALRREAHDLIGVAGNFGLLTLSALGRDLRAAALSGDAQAIQAVAEEIEVAMQASLAQLRARFLAQPDALAATPPLETDPLA